MQTQKDANYKKKNKNSSAAKKKYDMLRVSSLVSTHHADKSIRCM